ncbi:MAG: hypothetical protein LBP32_00890 [Spirochaetaceae bacterium]|jgi:hypothetical protein|nr:hypothetical protein [Spirochaetaceae bacterium]
MKALIFGIVILAAAVIAAAPAGFGWWGDVVVFLKGALPVIAALIGLIAVFIGIADIKDRAEVKKEKSGENKE